MSDNVACPCCGDDGFEQDMIDNDSDLNATEYRCLACGCEYWIEIIEEVTVVKEGCLDEGDDE